MANEFKVRKGLIVQGSGSNIFDVQGSQGQLFSVTDSLSGSLFSVNDISGIPIMEVFSDNTIKMGTFNQEAIIISGSRAGMGVANPQAKLHISGANNDSLFRIQSPASASIMFVSGSGLVGIGTLTPTQKISVDNGNVGFTSGFGISWDSDTEWVKRAAASDQLQFATGNTVRLNIGSTQGQLVAIGLGTTAASAQFQVRGGGATAATTAMRIEDSGGNARLTILDNGTSAFNTSHLYVSSSGNIGIGLTSPLAKLHISGANSLRMQNTGFDTFEWFFSAGTGIGFRNVTDGTTPFFVGGTDDIGIGTTNTSARLHISGASNAGLFEIDSPTINNIIYVSGSGNVGIGTNLPSADLHISGASIDSLLRVGSPTNASILFVTGSGNVGINTTSPMAFFSGSGGAFGSGEGNIVPTLTIFQSSSATGLNAAGLQIVGSGSSALAAARLNILTMGDKYAYLNIGTSGSGTENNYWEFAKRPSSAVHSLLLSNYSNGVYQSNIMSLSPGANTSTIGSSDQILLEGSTGYIGLQTTTPGTSDWIHLHSKPNEGNYINIDATQTSNPPPLTTATAKHGYGIITNAYYLAEPDYWMEIKLDGVIVLVPCYLPA